MRHIYADFIEQVARPVRYLGGEYQQVVKDPAAVDARVVLAFPDVYEIGMSHLGTKILYSLLNKHERVACERCFTPWVDMEKELRDRELPLVALESSDPLSAFDVIGVSLQYELTYSNVLTLLDLGGVPLRAADRANDAPLVLGGGPTATHPEPLAAFFDAFFIGEAEEMFADLALEWAAMRRAGRDRRDALAELASRYPLYVPSLYSTRIDEHTGMMVVDAPLDERAPAKVSRGMVENIDDYPFPKDAPVPYAEAVFDRASIEIARGCTEGCRFCQAGMVYRPVRERSPESIVDSLLGNVEAGGYDETSLTSLSTADYSCITPLIGKVTEELRKRKVSLSVSSLRAYGLNEDVLDDLASVRASGLTFAPEAGTQRMRDVVNKNVTEAATVDADRSSGCSARGWNRMKLYFMIGLPTEEDVDVRAVVRGRCIAPHDVGRSQSGGPPCRRDRQSVSTHVPKPHTPFQWCGDGLASSEIRPQASDASLRKYAAGSAGKTAEVSRQSRISVARRLSWLGVTAALADVARTRVASRGTRFDSWDEQINRRGGGEASL